MKHKGITVLIGLLAILTTTIVADVGRPNVVIIYGDDVGFADIGANGSTLIPTPNIDRLVSSGLNFTDGHCTASTCTPSRFSLMTGVHAFRHNVKILPPNAPLLISTDALTLPKLFKKAGYTTGIVGKWHLGIGSKESPPDWNGVVKPGPLEVGFDSSFLLPSTNDRVPCVFLRDRHVVNLDPSDPLFVSRNLEDVQHPGSTQYPDGKTDRSAMTYYPSSTGHDNSIINGLGRIGYMSGGESALWDDEEMADVFVNEAKAYIRKNKDKPFFLFFSSQDIHVPRTPHPRFQGTTKLGYRGDAMVQLDWSTGEILDTLEENGLIENSIVIFTSDNGPTYDNGYKDGSEVYGTLEEVDRGHDASGIWRGGKGGIFEGGTRVPFVISWPARIKPGTSDAMVSQIDLIASFAEFFEIDLTDNEAKDSRETLGAFLGEDSIGLDYMVEESRDLALRYGEWKFIQPTTIRTTNGRVPFPEALFNLSSDPSEQYNVIGTNPEKAEEMRALLTRIEEGSTLREMSR